jgi:putative nucleotidyltransferase with HDIG domain
LVQGFLCHFGLGSGTLQLGNMTREEAWNLVCEYTESDSLRRHMLCVETAMRFYAEKLGEDVEKWGLAGLLHDLDYEKHPDEHPLVAIQLLKEKGVSEEITQAVASHYAAKTGVEPESLMDKYLVACDELSGFISACVYVRPSKSVMDLEAKSVLKKLKEKSFAAGVSREDVQLGAELIGLPLSEHVGNLIEAFRKNAELLGLA